VLFQVEPTVFTDSLLHAYTPQVIARKLN